MEYRWNSYNKAHYTFENPPPKYIAGYKFNIFYPELVNTDIVPDYTLE